MIKYIHDGKKYYLTRLVNIQSNNALDLDFIILRFMHDLEYVIILIDCGKFFLIFLLKLAYSHISYNKHVNIKILLV